MSGKLDQSLGDIISTQRRTAGRRRSARRSGDRPAVTAPVGGIKKTTKPARPAATKPGTPAKAATITGESKIIVSNLVGSHAAPLLQPDDADRSLAQGRFRGAD